MLSMGVRNFCNCCEKSTHIHFFVKLLLTGVNTRGPAIMHVWQGFGHLA